MHYKVTSPNMLHFPFGRFLTPNMSGSPTPDDTGSMSMPKRSIA